MLQEKLLKVCKKFSFKNFKDFNFKKCFKPFSLFLILIVIGLALPRDLVHANVIADVVMGVIYPLIYVVFMILFLVAYLIAWIGASILNMSLNPAIMNQVFSNPGIYQGWTIIRDICNLLFLLLMLLVAFGTIVQSDRYNIKKSLPKLILAIFLINFSNVIAGVIIDFGNILMYGILGWMCSSSGTCFQDTMGGLMRVVNDFNTQYSLSNAVITGVGAQQAIGIAIATIYTYLYGFILLALAAFLLVRTAALALLLILAPFAYFGEVMPGMEKIASRWWNAIWSYTLFGPIFALMLYIAGELARITITVPPITNTELGAYGTLMTTIISNIIPLLFLVAVIPITKELGLAGTDTIMKNSTGLGNNIAKYAGGSLDRFVARGASMTGEGKYARLRRGLSYASPGAWKRAIKAHTADKEHDYDVAAGKTRNIVARTDDWGRKSPINYGEDAEQREVARQRADIKGKNKDELVHLMGQALDKGMMARAEAIALELAATSDMNDVYTKMKGKDGKNYQNTPDGFVNFMKEKFEPGYGTDKTGRLMAEIANLEKKDGHHALKGTSKYNSKKGEYEIVMDRVEREKEAAKEFGSVESQGKWKNMDSRTLLDQQYDAAGNAIKVDGEETWKWGDRGRQILSDMTEEDINSAWKGKSKHQKRLLKVLENKAEMASLNSLQKSKAERLRDNLREAVYGKPKKIYKGGGMGAGQIENQEPQEAREDRETHAREDEDEEERKRQGPKPVSGGGVSKEDFVKGTFADIRTEAKNIKSRSDLDNLHSKFTEAIDLTDVSEELKDVKKEEVKKTLEAIREADKALGEEIKQVTNKSGDVNSDSGRMSRETFFRERADQIHRFAQEVKNDNFQTADTKVASLKMHHNDFKELVKDSEFEKDSYMQNIGNSIANDIKEIKKQIKKK